MPVYVVTIAGVTKTLKGGLSISETANGRNKLSASVFSASGAYRPAVGAEVLVSEDGTRIFGGNIDTPSEAGVGGWGVSDIVTTISAVDFNAVADRRFIAETIPAGTLKAALIRVATYLAANGVTLDPAQVTGPTLAEIPFDYVTVTAALNQLSALTNGEYVWEIDYFKILRMVQASSTAAPFNVVDGDRHAIGDITVEPTAGFYANRVIVRFSAEARTAYAYLTTTGNFANAEHVTIGGQTYTFQTTLVDAADNVLIGATADDTLNNLIAAITHGPGAGTLYGTATAANASATAYLLRPGAMIAKALTAGAGGNSTVSTEVVANAEWVTEGGTAVTTFQLGADASLTNTVQANDLTEQGIQGLWEQVISEPSVFDTTIAQALADSYLAKAIAKPKRVRYKTAQTGIHPGMTQTITIAARNLTGTYVITDVLIRPVIGSYVQREVTAVGGSNLPSRWQDDARRLFAGTGGGSSIGGGASITLTSGGDISGSGTAGTLAIWTSTTSAVLGDSIITESGGVITVAGGATVTGALTINSAEPILYFYESDQGSNLKRWRFDVGGGLFNLQTLDDAGSSVLATPIIVSRSGAMTMLGGLTAGSGAVGIINSTGKIPAITSTYFAALAFDAANLTGTVPAATLAGRSLADLGTRDAGDLSSGTIPAGRLTGRSLADLGTRSASDLSSGNLAYARMPSGAGTWTATPTISGTLTLGADANPSINYTSSLGALATKYLTVHAAELWVETLVAQNTVATIGGRIIVAPTNLLTADLAPAGGSIIVKYNNLASGDRIYMESNGKVEWMAVTTGAGGSAGAYSYSVTRNLDGSGANQWYAGDAIVDTGTTGSGFLDLYSTAGVLSGTGPTIVGNVRTGTTYNNIAPRWAIGNLNGLYGYGTVYGAAFGDASATNVTIDATNGFRIRNSTTDKFKADTAGNLFLTGSLEMGTAGIFYSSGVSGFTTGTGWWLDYNSGTPRFRVGNPSGDILKWDGTNLSLVSTNLTINSSGITISPTTAFASGRSYRFTTADGYLGTYAFEDASAARQIVLDAEVPTGTGRVALALVEAYAKDDQSVYGRVRASAGQTIGAVDVEATYGVSLNAGPSLGTSISVFGSTGSPADTITLTAGTVTTTAASVVVNNASANLQVSTPGGTVTTVQPGFMGTSSAHNLVLLAGNSTIMKLFTTGGVALGAATDQGAGTLNVPATGGIYKNGVAYTNPKWVLQHYYTGTADAIGSYAAPSWYGGLMDLDAHREVVKSRHDLPLMLQEPDGDIFCRGDLLLASLEEAYLYIYQLHDRIATLEARAA